MIDNWKSRFFKEWRLHVHCECNVNSIDCFDIMFSTFFDDISQTYYDLKWNHSEACDYEVAFGIIKETFEPFSFYLFPVFASECFPE